MANTLKIFGGRGWGTFRIDSEANGPKKIRKVRWDIIPCPYGTDDH
jgi:hypothetical protein